MRSKVRVGTGILIFGLSVTVLSYLFIRYVLGFVFNLDYVLLKKMRRQEQ